ncbi:MAG: ABC transporter permease [Chloroflexota bacterium]|nr:ABC transporter permease [Chloroflexota bacterium]
MSEPRMRVPDAPPGPPAAESDSTWRALPGSDGSPPGLRPRLPRGVTDTVPIALAALFFLAAWKALVVLGGYPVFILPPPEVVAARFAEAWLEGTLAVHTAPTIVEVLLGFAAGSAVAVPAGYLLARSPVAERLLSPYLVAAQATPILALAPLIALWFGTGLLSKLVICSLIVFFPVAVATMVGVRSVDVGLLEMGRSFRATRRQILTKLEIPAALPSILGGMRVGVTLAVIGAIVGEWAGGERGLGVLINLARGSLFDTPLLFATLATLALLGVALYLLVLLVERRLIGARG